MGVGVTGSGSGTGVAVPLGDGLGDGVGVGVWDGVACDLENPSARRTPVDEFHETPSTVNIASNNNNAIMIRLIAQPPFFAQASCPGSLPMFLSMAVLYRLIRGARR